MAEVDRVNVIEEMLGYLSGEHRENISQEAFTDIANVFLDFTEEYKEQFDQFIRSKKNELDEAEEIKDKVKWVCNASMGHGKTTVLICWLKWLVSESREKSRIPVLLVIRERKMAEDIRDELKAYDEKCVVLLSSENKQEVEEYIQYHQIVIITHARLDNLALGYGNQNIYRIWEQYEMWDFDSNEILDPVNFICKRHRLIITDEKPSFVNLSIFDIGRDNNALDWFDDLSVVLDLNSLQSQAYKSQIISLIANQLIENVTDVTTSLIPEDEQKTNRAKNLIKIIKSMKNADENLAKIDSLKKVKHFEKMLKMDDVGRIDDYNISGKAGRKIIIAERIDYGSLGLNMLVLDGTAYMNSKQYKGFKPKIVKNYNNYSRLFMCQDVINTSKYSRQKKGYTTQKAISERIKNLRQEHAGLFVLPMKYDIPIYISLGAIDGEERNFFEERATENSRPINLLNTTGKNELKDRTSLYLTSLPRMNADYYKAIAISLYGNDVSLKINDGSNTFKWFADDKLDMIYRGEMYAEILQIMHRTALRKIKEDEPIYIYMAFDDAKQWIETIQPIFWEINNWYANEKINCNYHHISDESLYGRGGTIRKFAEQIAGWINNNVTFFNSFFNSLPKPLSEIDKGKGGIGSIFRKWLSKNNNWQEKEELINKIFGEFGYVIYENNNDNRKTKWIKKKSKERRKHDIFDDVAEVVEFME